MWLSSANSLTDDPMFSPMSLIYSKNINGSNTVPCGTPDLTLTKLDFSPSTNTFCSLLLTKIPATHVYYLSFRSGIISEESGVRHGVKALLKLRMSISTCCLLSKYLLISSTVIINCVWQDLFSRKPCWKSANIL